MASANLQVVLVAESRRAAENRRKKRKILGNHEAELVPPNSEKADLGWSRLLCEHLLSFPIMKVALLALISGIEKVKGKLPPDVEVLRANLSY